MYTSIRGNLANIREDSSATRRRFSWFDGVSGTVVFLGLTSLFTDISSEMVSSILPLYLTSFLLLTPFQFGIIDGLYQGVAVLVRLGGGLAADRWRRHKEVAAFGYGLSAACKLGLLAVGGAWAGLIAVIMLDRTGKGVRTAPRDALISLSSPPGGLAMAFGVHRALDTAGALLGPLVAFGLLSLVPGGFDVVFVTSFCVALVGLAILALFVENRKPNDDRLDARAVSLAATFGLLAARRFRILMVVGATLGLATISDGFIYLGFQRQLDFSLGWFPMLYVATALVYFALAIPAGRLADHIGRGRVLVGGYALLPVVYLILLMPSLGYPGLAIGLVLFGAYYAATDGVLMAMASAILPTDLRTSGLGLVTTATSLSRLLGSVLFGALWTWWNVETAVQLFMGGLLVAILCAALLVARAADPVTDA